LEVASRRLNGFHAMINMFRGLLGCLQISKEPADRLFALRGVLRLVNLLAVVKKSKVKTQVIIYMRFIAP